MTEVLPQKSVRRRVYLIFLLLVTSAVTLIALAAPILAPLSSPSLQTGQVAPQDIVAPGGITFESGVLTEQQRDAAERSVLPVYNSPDPGVARQQLESLRAALNFITNVRADTYATAEQKLADLASLERINHLP